MKIYNANSVDRVAAASLHVAVGCGGGGGGGCEASQSRMKEDCNMTDFRNGHVRQTLTQDSLEPQEQVELLNTSSSSGSFSTSAIMGDSRQPPSIGGSKVDLCPDAITFSKGGPWKSRTKMEKKLIFLVVFFFIAAATLTAACVVVYFGYQTTQANTSDNVCSTQDCLETAAYISNSIDTSINPCDDFYQFACGGWIKKNDIPPAQHSINNFVVIRKKLQESMRDLLSEMDPTAPEAVTKARLFFKSCEDTDTIDSKGVEPLMELLRDGGDNLFPTLDDDWAEEDNMNLSQILARVGAVGGLGSSPIIKMSVHADQKQSDKNIIYFSQTGHFLPNRQVFLDQRNNTVLMLYERLYVDVMSILGANITTAISDAKDLVDFEILVINATEPPALRRDAERLYNKLTLRALTDRYPQFDWLAHVRRQFSPVGIEVTMDEEVVVNALTYYDNIFPIINSTSTRTLLNYCMWQVVYPLTGMLSKHMRDIKKQFSRSLHGTVRSQDRWKECVSDTDSNFPHASSRLYVDHKFSRESKIRVENMISDLIASFKEMLHETDWMSEETKRAALEKADAIEHKIGFPEYVLNDTALNEKTEKIKITHNKYMQNRINVFLHSREKNLKNLRKPVDKKEWPLSAATVNAFYNKQTNEILFPAGILHRPFFSNQYPDALNYGGIGFVIGHEITHGFDDSGRGFDKNGNLHLWWQPEDLNRFRQRYECMVNQYGNYTEPNLGVKLNGRLTIGEDIADNGGLKEAYRAYRKLVAKRGEEELRLPVLNYTPDQLFFIGAAQSWCGRMRDEVMKFFLRSNYHSPMRFRVIGPMQNNEDFSRAFSCPVGSYMNPKHKCGVW